jgi:hypothetical protein
MAFDISDSEKIELEKLMNEYNRKVYERTSIDEINIMPDDISNPTLAESIDQIPPKKPRGFGETTRYVFDEFIKAGIGGTQDFLEELMTKRYKASVAYAEKKALESPTGKYTRKTPWGDEVYDKELIEYRQSLGDKEREAFERAMYIQNLADYNNKLGALQAFIPPPKDYRFLKEYQDSAYGTKYEVKDNESFIGSLGRGLIRFVEAVVVVDALNPLKSPTKKPEQVTKRTKNFIKEVKEIYKNKGMKEAANTVKNNAKNLVKEKGSETGKWLAKKSAEGTLAEVIAFNPEEPNIVDLVLMTPEEKRDGWETSFAIAEALRENPNDAEWQKIGKQALSGSITNVLLGIGFKGVKFSYDKTLKPFVSKDAPIPVEKRALDLEATTKEKKAIIVEAEKADSTQLLPENPIYNKADVEELDNHNINLKNLDTKEGLEEELLRLAEVYKKFAKRRGTKASHGATEARSLEMLKKDPNGEEILKLIDANVMTPELVYASRVLMIKAYDQAHAAAEILVKKTKDGTATQAHKGEFARQSARFGSVLERVTGVTAATGRMLDTFNMPVMGSKIAKAKHLEEFNKEIDGVLSRKGHGGIVGLAEKFLDDPLKAKDAFEETARSRTMKKISSVIYASMLSDPATGSINLISSLATQVYENAFVMPTAYVKGGIRNLASRYHLGVPDPDRITLSQIKARYAGLLYGTEKGLLGKRLPGEGLLRSAGYAGSTAYKADLPEHLQTPGYEYKPIAQQTGIGDDTKVKLKFQQLNQQYKEGVITEAEYAKEATKYGIGRVTRGVITTPMRILLGGDAFLKNMAYNARLQEEAWLAASKKFNPEGKIGISQVKLMRSDKVKNFIEDFLRDPPAYVHDESIGEAAFLTFTKANAFASAVTKTLPPGTMRHAFSRPFIPFVQTVTNLWEYSLLNTPFAPMLPAYKQAIEQGGREADLAASRMIAGTTLMGMSYAASQGIFGDKFKITGGGIPDPLDYKYAQTKEAAGIHDFSVKYTDSDGQLKSFGYNRLDPFALPIAMAADMADLVYLFNHMHKEGKAQASDYLLEFIKMSTLGMWKNVAERNPILTGMEEIGRALYSIPLSLETAEPGELVSGGRIILNRYIQSVTPNIGRRLIYMDDPYTLDTYATADTFKVMLQSWAALGKPFTDWSKGDISKGDATREEVSTIFTLLDKINAGEATEADLKEYEKRADKHFIFNPDIIPFRVNMISGKIQVNELYRDEDSMFLKLIKLGEVNTIIDDPVAKELAGIKWSKSRLDQDFILRNGYKYKITKGEYLAYQLLISKAFRSRVALLMEDESYLQYKNRDQYQAMTEMVQVAWENAVDTGKNHILSLRPDMFRKEAVEAKIREDEEERVSKDRSFLFPN